MPVRGSRSRRDQLITILGRKHVTIGTRKKAILVIFICIYFSFNKGYFRHPTPSIRRDSIQLFLAFFSHREDYRRKKTKHFYFSLVVRFLSTIKRYKEINKRIDVIQNGQLLLTTSKLGNEIWPTSITTSRGIG